MVTKVLGIHGFSATSNRELHDTGASLIEDGRVIAAVNEERFSRNKKDGTFPFRSIESVLDLTGTLPTDIDHIAFADERPIWQMKNILRYLVKTYRRTGLILFRYLIESMQRTFDITRKPPKDLLDIPVVFIEHHKAHVASAFFTSPWESASIITIDGMGDYCVGGIIGLGKGSSIEIMKRTNGFFSPGIFYTSITNYLGFRPGFHEGKVTGLAAYGSQKRALPIMKDILSYEKGSFDFYSEDVPKMLNKVDHRSVLKKLSPFSMEDIAAAAQGNLEDVILEFVDDAIKLTRNRNLVVAGGIFANVRLNQRIAELDCIDGLHVYPAMNDSGLASGAALYQYYKMNKRPNPIPIENLYLGPKYGSHEIEESLRRNELAFTKNDHIVDVIAEAVVNKFVVGHFHGNLEYGPRALGNRSILVSAEDPTINDTLNARLHRTEFMPFAPAMLEEFADEYLIGYHSSHLPSRFMAIAYNVTKEFKKRAPAAVHIDGTARPQIVRENDNPRFHRIIERYYEQTGIPLIINTSFNMHEEPIVSSPDDAIRSFHDGAVDILVMEDFLVANRNNAIINSK